MAEMWLKGKGTVFSKKELAQSFFSGRHMWKEIPSSSLGKFSIKAQSAFPLKFEQKKGGREMTPYTK